MENHIFPAIGHFPVTTLKTQHFTALLRVIEDKGFLEVASRTRQQLCNIMRYAVQQGLTENNPAQHLLKYALSYGIQRMIFINIFTFILHNPSLVRLRHQ